MRGALWAVIAILSLMMIAVATARILRLGAPAVGTDAGFAHHPVLTVVHIVPGLAFIVLGPFQFMSGLRKRRPALHRWTGRAFIGSAMVVGVTALVMSPQIAIGGALESSATSIFGVLFLACLGKGFLAILERRVAEHRRWMIRAYAIGFAVATIRPIVGFFFATSRLTHLTPRDFFGVAFWVGFLLNLAAAELWIRASGYTSSMQSPYE